MIYAASKVLTKAGMRDIVDIHENDYVWGYHDGWGTKDGADWFRVMKVKRSGGRIKMQCYESVFGSVVCEPKSTYILYGDIDRTPEEGQPLEMHKTAEKEISFGYSGTSPIVSYFKGFYEHIPIDICNDEDDARNFFCGLMTTSETVFGSGTGKRAERKIKLSKKDYRITEWLKGNKFIHGSFGSYETSFRTGNVPQMKEGTPKNIRAYLCGLCTCTEAMKDNHCTNNEGTTRAMVQITLPGHESAMNILTMLNSIGLQAMAFKGRSGDEKVDSGRNTILMIDKDKEYFDECIGQYMLRDYLVHRIEKGDGCPSCGTESFGMTEHKADKDMEAEGCMLILESDAHFWSNGLAVRNKANVDIYTIG